MVLGFFIGIAFLSLVEVVGLVILAFAVRNEKNQEVENDR